LNKDCYQKDLQLLSTDYNTDAKLDSSDKLKEDPISPSEPFVYADLNIYAKYPNIDPVKLTQVQRGKEVHLRAYHMPVPEGKKRRGVIFYIHGYGSNI
jgi:hypothetical protein